VTRAAEKSVAIVQSSYIPWKGYFDLINSVDEFILFDDRQFTKRDWRSRNRIKTAQGVAWLSIPVTSKGKYTQRIDETEIADPQWTRRHWATIEHAYRHAPHFEAHADLLRSLYLDCDEALLSRVNRRFLEAVCDVLEIRTRLTWSSAYTVEGAKTERLVELCKAAGATRYLSGPTARAYLDEGLFAEAQIELRYMDYSNYPPYDQLYPPFEHKVSILDLLVHTGASARNYLNSTSVSLASSDAA
jgi:hypothetical protein